MPRNPKYDQIQPKGHHSEENPQSTTKMPGNPKFVKIASKLENSTNCNHNLISSEGGQDTSACKIAPKLEKSPDRNHNLISSEGGQDTAPYYISGHSLHVCSRKCPETPNLTRFTKSKLCQNHKNSNRPWPWTNQFWRWSRYISMQNFRTFPPCVLQEMPRNPKFDPFH